MRRPTSRIASKDILILNYQLDFDQTASPTHTLVYSPTNLLAPLLKSNDLFRITILYILLHRASFLGKLILVIYH